MIALVILILLFPGNFPYMGLLIGVLLPIYTFKYLPKKGVMRALGGIFLVVLGLFSGFVFGGILYSTTPYGKSESARFEKEKKDIDEAAKQKQVQDEKNKQIADEQKKIDDDKKQSDYLANLRFNIDDIFNKNISEIKQKYPEGKLSFNSYYGVDTGYSFKIKDYDIYSEWYHNDKSLVVDYITVTFSNNKCEDNEDAITKSNTLLPTIGIDMGLLSRQDKTYYFNYKDNKQVTVYCTSNVVNINYTPKA